MDDPTLTELEQYFTRSCEVFARTGLLVFLEQCEDIAERVGQLDRRASVEMLERLSRTTLNQYLSTACLDLLWRAGDWCVSALKLDEDRPTLLETWADIALERQAFNPNARALETTISLLNDAAKVGLDPHRFFFKGARCYHLRFKATGDNEDARWAARGYGAAESHAAIGDAQPINLAFAALVLDRLSKLEDKTQQVALVEIAKAVSFIDRALKDAGSDRQALCDVWNLRGNAAKAYYELCSQSEHDAKSATQAFFTAIRYGTKHNTRGALDAAVTWAMWAGARERWSEAVRAFQHVTRLREDLVSRQQSRFAKETVLKRHYDIVGLAALAALKDKQVRAATQLFERNQALMLRESLAPQCFRMPEPTRSKASKDVVAQLSSLNIIGKPATLLYLVPHRSAAWAITPNSTEPIIIWLPDMTDDQIERFNTTYLNAYEAYRNHSDDDVAVAAWSTELFDAIKWLQEAVVLPLADVIAAADHFVVIPTPGLSFLPVHAAWPRDIGDGSDGPVFSYTPTATTLLELQKRVAPIRDILAVGPEEGRTPTVWEALWAAALFPKVRSRPLIGGDASCRRVLQHVSNASVLHFSCHGNADITQPLHSHLRLANDERLRICDILEHGSLHARLVVLSACETGRVSHLLSHEYINLATTFLHAGAQATIAPTWVVDSLTACILVTRFYDYWRRDEHHPIVALHKAQHWLRRSTLHEIHRHFVDRTHDREDTSAQAHAIARELEPRATRMPRRRWYAHPFHWAAFQYHGV